MSGRPMNGRGVSGPRSTNERLRRLLVMLPWLMEQGEATVADVARRFELSEDQVVADLELVALCGLPPFQDELVDVFIDEGVVHVGVPRLFTKPLRLTAPEGFALLAAARSAMELPGADADGALGRALRKLAAAIGDDGVVIDLHRPPLADDVADAVTAGERVDIVYWTTARDERTERRITPRAVFHDRGHWYVVADDHHRDGERIFRIDRIESLTRTGVFDEVRPTELPDEPQWFSDDPSIERAVLIVQTGARWMLERDPVESVTELPGGAIEVVVPVVSEQWLERLLLRAGREIEVREPAKWTGLAARAAGATLGRYADKNAARSSADATP